jgi:CheY-like chemotaxis protein
MIHKAVNVINFRVDERNQNLTVKLDSTIPDYLIGDDQRLTQIITNLLSNAVKFTPDGGNLFLVARLVDYENGFFTVQIDVIDSGIGISKEQQARLFSPFQQADSGTSREFGGTGLGLAISKRLIEMMNGRIWVESDLGKGATFSFTFQAEQGEVKNLNLLSGDVTWKTVRWLVIDDCPETLEYFSIEAARLSISCDLVSSGEAALELIEKNGLYDIYFIDWKMPGMNGIEVARRIKDLSAGKPSMVIMISATEWSVISSEANEAGVDRFLQKPLFHSDIVDCLNECFGLDQSEIVKVQDESDDFNGYRILLVEDVEINREIVIAILEPTGLAIECAENGKVALEMVQNAPKPYDVIFMDLQMPEMDGYEATRKIREFEKASASLQVPIIAMTANVFREDVEKCLEEGMNDHIGKPLDFEKVLEKLRIHLQKTLT